MKLYMIIKKLNMKKILFLLTIILLSTNSVLAQRNMNRQKIMALKTSYITNSLNLTPNEAEKFWPVFNLYSKNIQTLKMSLEGGIHKKVQASGGIDSISETEAKLLLDEIISLEQQITNNEVKMINELSKIISFKQIIKLKKTQREFNKRILQEYGRRRRMQQGQ